MERKLKGEEEIGYVEKEKRESSKLCFLLSVIRMGINNRFVKESDG